MNKIKLKKNNYLLFAICLILFSCANNKSRILTNGGIKYWDSYDLADKYFESTYSFDNKNNCKRYYYSKIGKRKLFDYDDIVGVDTTWSFVGDTTFSYEGFERRILKFTKDTIWLQNKVTGDSILLVMSQFQ